MATGGSDETEDALGAMGLKLENAPDKDFEVWPENWLPISVFNSLNTQWRIAPNGRRYGLDYAAIQATLQLMRVPQIEWAELFQALRSMEAEFLEAISG